MLPDTIRLAREEIRGYRALQWKIDWCKKHGAYREVQVSRFRTERLPDVAAAPEPTDKDLDWPETMISVQWDTGYITITMDALQKLPANQRNKIYKLGGMKP